MLSIFAKVLAGPLLDRVFGIVERHQAKQINRDKLEVELRGAVLDAMTDISDNQVAAILAEARGESWLQRNWRPMVAVCFAGIVVFYALVLPIAVDWFGANPVRIGDKLLEWIMQAVMVCLGGYIGGRSLEKIARVWKR